MASKRFRFYFILARTPLDATINRLCKIYNRQSSCRYCGEEVARDQRANQRRCTSEPSERFHCRDQIGSRFGDLGCIGNPTLADKARRCRSTRKACRDLESSRMDSTLRRHTLLVAAILAPLRHFDT
jgi:hypothetical protein